ncbi:hypothetical protein GGR53DRAFT_501461 [Hypoxylon sp. FL1150]|nr:hypothetical protein GGR53DRAFT_501461 [Hypoxylon sp. FL1150]
MITFFSAFEAVICVLFRGSAAADFAGDFLACPYDFVLETWKNEFLIAGGWPWESRFEGIRKGFDCRSIAIHSPSRNRNISRSINKG